MKVEVGDIWEYAPIHGNQHRVEILQVVDNKSFRYLILDGLGTNFGTASVGQLRSYVCIFKDEDEVPL